MGTQILFGILAAVAVVCAIGVVANESPVRSALNLVGVLASVALLYLTLNASFVAAIQIMVYAGAIMVLFVFVIMLLNLGTPEKLLDRMKPQQPLALIAGLVLVVAIAGTVAAIPAHSTRLPATMTGAFEIGKELFTPTWMFPFEAVSVLLLIATIGAVVLAKRRI